MVNARAETAHPTGAASFDAAHNDHKTTQDTYGPSPSLPVPAQSTVPVPGRRGTATPTSQSRQLRSPRSDSHLSTAPLASQAAAAGAFPSLTATSPPRYLTRGSLGSVAFSPGSSPGRQTQSKGGSSLRPGERVLQSNGLPGANHAFPEVEEDDGTTQHYEHFHKQSMRPSAYESANLLTDVDSPEMQELETHLAQISPKTPNIGHGTTDANASPNGSLSNRRRVQPVPLDLSPPRPSWMISNAQHPAIQDTSSQGVMSASSSLGELSTQVKTYAGLGLGLPFSDSLSSLPSTSSSLSIGDTSILHSQLFQSNGQAAAAPASASSSRPRQVSAAGVAPNANVSHQIRRQRSDIGLSSPESPPMISDRKGLIGLGELSTPRWTAAIHERRWGQTAIPPSPALPSLPQGMEGHSRNESDDWQGDVLGNYTDDKEVSCEMMSSSLTH